MIKPLTMQDLLDGKRPPEPYLGEACLAREAITQILAEVGLTKAEDQGKCLLVLAAYFAAEAFAKGRDAPALKVVPANKLPYAYEILNRHFATSAMCFKGLAALYTLLRTRQGMDMLALVNQGARL